MRLLSTFGLLPGTWPNLFLILISGIFESIGLSMFVPLIHLMSNSDDSDLPRPFSDIYNIVDKFGFLPDTIVMLAIIASFSLLALGIAYLQRKLLIRSKTLYMRNTRNELFEATLDSSWGYSSNKSHGEILNQMTTESGRAGQALGFELMAVALIIQIFVFFVFSVAIAWQLSIIAGIFGPLIYYIIRPFTFRGKRLGHRLTVANRDFSFIVLEYLRGLKLLKATASVEFAKEGVFKTTENLCQTAFESELNISKVYFVTQALPVLALTVIIGVSFELLKIQTSVIFVFLIFMIRIAPRIAQVQQLIQSYVLNSPAVELVHDIIDSSRIEIEDGNFSGKIFKGIEESIVLENVNFDYPNAKIPAVKNVSLTIGRNQTVAIVGSSGSGKSTLMDLLTRLRIPTKGKIIIDGVELSKFSLLSWRKRIGIVTQEPITFNASLRDNLMFFNPEVSEADISRVISLAHLKEVVADLPDGLDTVLGESGVRFSGGQKQRISLARALIRNPDLLLLDEATSALDNETERYVQDSLNAIAHTMTIVIIAHRLSTVRRADIIYVMEEGEIVESGSYDELIVNRGRFAELRQHELM
jgi:ATP-binding cassette, subfamily B, bacterial MsbA